MKIYFYRCVPSTINSSIVIRNRLYKYLDSRAGLRNFAIRTLAKLRRAHLEITLFSLQLPEGRATWSGDESRRARGALRQVRPWASTRTILHRKLERNDYRRVEKYISSSVRPSIRRCPGKRTAYMLHRR